MEPLLGPVDLDECGATPCDLPGGMPDHPEIPPHGAAWRGVQWVIAGGESGPRARPSHPDWFRSLRDQCAAANVPFHFKQWGEWAPDADGDRCIAPDGRNMPNLEPNGSNGDGAARIRRIGKRRAGRVLDGRTHDDLPAVP
jgi:protein gp37